MNEQFVEQLKADRDRARVLREQIYQMAGMLPALKAKLPEELKPMEERIAHSMGLLREVRQNLRASEALFLEAQHVEDELAEIEEVERQMAA